MKPGKTSAIPVSASVPRRDTHQVSIRPVDACASMTRMFGQASLSNVGAIGPFSNRSVRALMGGAAGKPPSSRVRSGWERSSIGLDAGPRSRLRQPMSARRHLGFGRVGRRRTREQSEFGRIERPAGQAIDHNRVGDRAGRTSAIMTLAPSGAKCRLPKASSAISTGRKSRPRSVRTYSSRGGFSL